MAPPPVKHFLVNAWLARGCFAWLLWPVSQLYGGLVRLRLALYSSNLLHAERFQVPVVVVGNVVAGGAGKTPLVIALVKHLRAHGLHAGVVSRGYGRAMQGTVEVTPDLPISASGDEPALIRRATNAPVFVAAKRVDAVRAMLAAHPYLDVVVCDDGLQHRALVRDVDVIVFDDRGVGNGWLLPAGPLRQAWPITQTQNATLVLHTGQSPAFSGYRSSRKLASHALAVNGEQVDLASLLNQPLTALAGIASPDSFFAMLRALGLSVDKTIPLPDHVDFEQISPESLQIATGSTVLCTEKDAIKLFALPAFSQYKLLAVPLLFSPEPAFLAAFDACLNPFLLARPSRT